MSSHSEVLQEIAQLDVLLAQGYKMKCVYENLSGTFIELQCEADTTTLQLLTADARKYLAVKLRETMIA
ncbi:hypothetical protein AAGS61_06575 [Lysinibacillus sp. KU-BSD001]|uniref:hypothetical protein n=1 Tax=Lysinibacillus sp. KU-BSD001 TaxID=3141328 RepID=UPI0036F051BC